MGLQGGEPCSGDALPEPGWPGISVQCDAFRAADHNVAGRGQWLRWAPCLCLQEVGEREPGSEAHRLSCAEGGGTARAGQSQGEDPGKDGDRGGGLGLGCLVRAGREKGPGRAARRARRHVREHGRPPIPESRSVQPAARETPAGWSGGALLPAGLRVVDSGPQRDGPRLFLELVSGPEGER